MFLSESKGRKKAAGWFPSGRFFSWMNEFKVVFRSENIKTDFRVYASRRQNGKTRFSVNKILKFDPGQRILVFLMRLL